MVQIDARGRLLSPSMLYVDLPMMMMMTPLERLFCDLSYSTAPIVHRNDPLSSIICLPLRLL